MVMVFVCHGTADMRILGKERGGGDVSLSSDTNTDNTKILECRDQRDTWPGLGVYLPGTVGGCLDHKKRRGS